VGGIKRTEFNVHNYSLLSLTDQKATDLDHL